MTEMTHGETSLENLGNMLKTQREINGLTRRDVVVKTKIPLDQLEFIEDGRLSSLPPVFAKGFLRAYATELGLDAEDIVENYRQLTGGFKNEPASREPLAPKYIETSVGSNMGPLIKCLLVLILLVAALAGAFYFSPAFRATATSMFPLLERFAPDAEPAPDGTAPEAALAPEPQPAAAAAAPQPGGTLILASSKDNIWAQVIIDGEPPEFFYFKAGQKIGFKARRDIVVSTGEATALTVNWNGEDLGRLSGADNVRIAEVRFPRG